MRMLAARGSGPFLANVIGGAAEALNCGRWPLAPCSALFVSRQLRNYLGNHFESEGLPAGSRDGERPDFSNLSDRLTSGQALFFRDKERQQHPSAILAGMTVDKNSSTSR